MTRVESQRHKKKLTCMMDVLPTAGAPSNITFTRSIESGLASVSGGGPRGSRACSPRRSK